MKKITYFLTVACAIFLGSCASTTFMSIDVMRPATVSFPPDIVNLAVVDNTGIQPDSMNHITISPTKEVTIVKVSSDSAKTTFKQAFVQFMNEENYFNKIELYPHNMRTDSDYDRVQPLKRTEVKEICEAMDADALVSFDIYITSSKLETVLHDYGIGLDVLLMLKGITGVSARIYDKNGSMISPPQMIVDSAFWSDFGALILSRESAMNEMALIAAEKFTKRLIPYWEKQDRWYFSNNNSEMKEAAKLAKEGKWREAALIWGAVFEKEKKDINKAKIASNIALANECLDDIENAVKWIDIAFSLLPEKDSENDITPMTTIYRTLLKERENNISKLKIQLGSEEEEDSTESE